jgi:hypothetical protein
MNATGKLKHCKGEKASTKREKIGRYSVLAIAARFGGSSKERFLLFCGDF